jgi:cyclic pyranopterin phosphate synthase
MKNRNKWIIKDIDVIEEIADHAKKYLRLIITKKCNLKCYYCHGEGMLNVVGNLFKGSQLIELIKVIGDLGFNKVKISGGEPLLYPDIFDVISAGSRCVKEIGITTNGVLLSRLHDKLDTIPRTVGFNVSINTLSSRENQRITGRNLLANSLDGLNNLLKKGFSPKINMVVHRKNIKDVIKMVKFAGKKNIVLKLLDIVDSRSNEYLDCSYIYEYLKRHFQVRGKGIRNGYRIYDINGTEVELALRIYGRTCKRCSRFPCGEGISSIRLSTSGAVCPCFGSISSICRRIDEFPNAIIQARNDIDRIVWHKE